MTVVNAPSMGSFGAAWTAGGYSGTGNVAGLLGTLRGRSAVVVGNGAYGVHELQVARRRLGGEAVIFAVNDIGMYLDQLDHWVSLHSAHLPAWKQVRWLHHKGPEDTVYHSYEAGPEIDYAWQGLTPLFALSGYFAMQVAYLMGAERIVLCGCPGSPQRRFFEAAPRAEFGYGGGEHDGGVREQVIKEMARLPEFKARVSSLGGWTQQFFGGLTS